MWFGTGDGLNRYDGYEFTVFTNSSFDSTSISHNHITTLFEDRKNRLWVGTIQGLNVFDQDLEVFYHIKLPTKQDKNLGRCFILNVCEDQSLSLIHI